MATKAAEEFRCSESLEKKDGTTVMSIAVRKVPFRKFLRRSPESADYEKRIAEGG